VAQTSAQEIKKKQGKLTSPIVLGPVRLSLLALMIKDLKKKIFQKKQPKNKDAADHMNPPAISMSVLEGATDFTLNNPLISNIGGNATIFKFDGG
jgi:hypothetical protein